MYRVRILTILLIWAFADSVAQENVLDIKTFPDGAVLQCVRSDEGCYYFVTSVNNLLWTKSDSVRTSVLIDHACDGEIEEIVDLRDTLVEYQYLPLAFYKFDSLFLEFVSWKSDSVSIFQTQFNIYNHEFQCVRSFDFNAAYESQIRVVGSPVHRMIGLQYPPDGGYYLWTLNRADTSFSVSDLDLGIAGLRAIIFDEEENRYLTYNGNGLSIHDSTFAVTKHVVASYSHTAVYGQIEQFQDKVITFGARLPPGIDLWQITFNTFNKDLELLSYDTYGDKDERDYPFLSDCLDQTPSAIFTGAMIDIPPGLHTSSEPLEFVISKYDHNFDLIWRHTYGGDATYVMYGVNGTIEGGCIAWGSRWNTIDNTHYPFMLKIEADGTVTNTEEHTPQEAHAFTLYGNPVSTTLHVYADFNPAREYTLFLSTITGQPVLTRDLTPGMNTIPVSHIPPANYVYTVVNQTDNRVVESHVIAVVR